MTAGKGQGNESSNSKPTAQRIAEPQTQVDKWERVVHATLQQAPSQDCCRACQAIFASPPPHGLHAQAPSFYVVMTSLLLDFSSIHGLSPAISLSSWAGTVRPRRPRDDSDGDDPRGRGLVISCSAPGCSSRLTSRGAPMRTPPWCAAGWGARPSGEVQRVLAEL